MDNNLINSCLMLACSLYTPVSLSSIFDSEDLKDTGIELESHITLLYAQGTIIPNEELITDIKSILGNDDFVKFNSILEEDTLINVLDIFDIGIFENDSDYVVLKLNLDKIKDSKYRSLAEYLYKINKGLRSKYKVQSEYEYTPHLSLAELKPGTARKYYESEKLKLVLINSKVSAEDLVISYGTSNEKEDRKRFNLTKYHAVDRFFREENLKREKPD